MNPLTCKTLLIGSALLCSLPALAQRSETPSPAGRSALLPPSSGARPMPLRTRFGALAGLSMQKTDLMLGVTHDFGNLGPRLRLVGDFTLGFRLTEVTLEPMAGVHLPLELRSLPGLELYLGGLLGVNLTVMRGSVAVSVPLRGVVGMLYRIQPGLGLGVELSTEAGPLVSPFLYTYGAAQLSVLVGWTI